MWCIWPLSDGLGKEYNSKSPQQEDEQKNVVLSLWPVWCWSWPASLTLPGPGKQWGCSRSILERLPGELCLSLGSSIQFLEAAHDLKWSLGSNVAIRAVCLQNPVSGSHAELKQVRQATVISTGQDNFTIWRVGEGRIKKKKCMQRITSFFGKCRVDRNDHLKPC